MSDTSSILQYKVVVLGSASAGKTVLLSAMYRELCLLRPDNGFFLTTDPQTEEQLRNRYRSITNGVFPQGTTAIDELRFDCLVASIKSKANYKVMEITYYDYAGGRLIEAQSLDLPRLLTYIQEADALLIILDGVKLLRLMQGKIGPEDFFDDDLLRIFGHIRQSMAPIHFVLTKWDVLKPHYSFGEVREHLLNYPDFRDVVIVAGRTQRIVRLIPVSAVGLGSFELQSDDTMKRIPEQRVWPLYVEYPLSCVLVDQFNTKVRQQLHTRETQLKSKSSSIFMQRLFLRIGALFSGGAVELLQGAQVPLPILASAVSIEKLLELGEHLRDSMEARRVHALKKAAQMQKSQRESLETVENLQEAVDYAVERCTYIGYKLEGDFPESILWSEENKNR